MPTSVYTMHAVVIDRVSDLVIGGITDQAIAPGLSEMLLAGDGAVDPTYVAVAESRPVISFTSTDVVSLLAEGSDTFAVAGLKLSASAIAKAFLQKLDEGGTRAGAGNHVSVAVNEGIMVPRTLTAADNQPATLTCDIVATFDGSNAPLVITDSQNLLGTAAVSTAYVQGPVTLNGSGLDGVQSITVDFGIELMVLSGDGAVYPTYVAIASRRPRITVRVSDAGALADWGLTGTAQSATDSLVWLRKVTEGGTRVADVTEEHIKITIDEGLISVGAVSGSHGSYQGCDVTITPTYDGTNAIMAVDTTAAIV